MEDNWRNNTDNPLLPLKEDVPALFYKQMCEAGVLGFIQSATVPLRALYDKAIIHDPTFTFDNLPEVCDIKLDEHQYAAIKQMVKERRTFFLEFDIRNHFRMGPVKYYNVIGKIKGCKYPDEYVMASGHLDAFDVATGGVDCGSGVTPVMEAARMIMKSGAKPKRTMLFCAFAGEEFGLLGSTAWVKANKDKLDKISNLFNRDGGPTPPGRTQCSESDVSGLREDMRARQEDPSRLSVRSERSRPIHQTCQTCRYGCIRFCCRSSPGHRLQRKGHQRIQLQLR